MRQPHEYHRNGTAKLLTLFHPADGQVRVKGVTSTANAVLHPGLKEELSTILATLPTATAEQVCAANRADWLVWQEGLTQPITLPDELPPLRMLLIWDNLAGHSTPEMVLWLFSHGIMPLYTPLSGSWLNMTESAADPQTARLGGPAPTNGRRNHQLAGSDSPGLEPEPDGLCVGWEASLAAGASASTRARCGRVGSMCASAGAPAAPHPGSRTAIHLSPVHQRWACCRR